MCLSSVPRSIAGTCCIGDFSLAIKSGSDIEAELQKRPAVEFRYLAPECLEGSVVQNDIDSLRKVDMYSCGLVVWEIARRCAIKGNILLNMLFFFCSGNIWGSFSGKDC